MLSIIHAHAHELIPAIRTLFVEYAESLDFNLCFQNFEQELAELPGRYAPPAGRLLLGLIDGCAAGCVAMRPLVADQCEMKRLWVRPQYRGIGVGRALARAIMDEAAAAGYRVMRLDTVSTMKEALSLYGTLGFRVIPPYTHNPLPGAVYMEAALTVTADPPHTTSP